MVRCVCSPRTFLCSQILQITCYQGESKSTSLADCAMENLHFKMSIQEPKHSQVYKCHIFSSPSYCAKSRSTAPWSNRAACHRSMAVLQVMQRFVHTVFTRLPSDKTWWQHTETAFKKQIVELCKSLLSSKSVEWVVNQRILMNYGTAKLGCWMVVMLDEPTERQSELVCPQRSSSTSVLSATARRCRARLL